MNKGDDMINLVREPLLANIHNNLESYIMCCIPVFPFYFSADFFIYILLEDNWNNEQCILRPLPDTGAFGNGQPAPATDTLNSSQNFIKTGIFLARSLSMIVN